MNRCWNFSFWLSSGAKILGPVDHGHAAAADERGHPVARNLGPDLQEPWHGVHGQLTGVPQKPQKRCWGLRRWPHWVQKAGADPGSDTAAGAGFLAPGPGVAAWAPTTASTWLARWLSAATNR
jgi:hypothetical protein